MAIKPVVKIFKSLEEANREEYKRRAEMSPQERLEELGALQARVWGSDWVNKPIKKVATWEKVNW